MRKKRLSAYAVCLLFCRLLFAFPEAYGQNAPKPISVMDALSKVTKELGTQFVYDSEALKGKTTDSDLSNLKTKNVEDVLKRILYPNKLVFLYVKANYYTVVPKDRVGSTPETKSYNEITSVQTGNQATPSAIRTITGIVVSENGLPMEGASVTTQKSNAGTSTGKGGQFTISVQPGDVLSISSVNYQQQDVTISNQTSIRITLLPTVGAALDQVVVVGYGTRKKSDVTGAITSINEQAIKDVPASNLASALQGQGAGVDIQRSGSDGKPGATPTIRIRGSRSLGASNTPLIVVDGIPFNGSINDINQDDVSSVDILKDASSTAIYGSRGANGVLLITTKRGRTGKPVATYRAYVGQTRIVQEFKLMNAGEFILLKKWSQINGNPGKYTGVDDPQFLTNTVFELPELEGIKTGRNTDWQKYIYKTGIMTDHQLGITGGTDVTQYAVSAGYFNQTGIYTGQGFERFTIKASIDQQFGKILKIGLSTLNNYSTRKGESASNMTYTLRASPLVSPFDSAGNVINDFLPGSTSQVWNPLGDILPGAAVEDRKRSGTFTTLYVDVNLAKGLKYRLNAGAEINNEVYGNFYASKTNFRRGTGSSSSNRTTFNTNYTLENIITYDRTFGLHRLNFTGLYSIQESTTQSNQFNNTNIAADYLAYYNPTYGANLTGSGSYSKWDILSYMGRINYAFTDRYLLTLTMRSDGSSRLAPGNKYHVFPSAAVAWNLSKESFFQNIRAINNLKLRVSYGNVGNTAINPYQTLGNLGSTVYNYGSTTTTGAYLTNAANTLLTWENTATANLGLDFSLLNNRVFGAIEVYKQYTSSLLLPQTLPITSGIPNAIVRNIGKTENKGVEVQISTINIQGKNRNDFSWTSDFNIFLNRGKITQLAAGVTRDVSNGWFIGQPISVYYDYKKVGIWQNTPEDSAEARRLGLTVTGASSVIGTVRVADISGPGGKPDEKIDGSYDRVIVGTNQPKWEGGITNRFGFKGFDLTVVAFARVGSTLSSAIEGGNGVSTYGGTYNSLKIDYWTPFNHQNFYPKPSSAFANPPYQSTLGYFDGSFVKIRSLSLGYNISPTIVQKIGFRSIRAYATASDPFILFSPYRKKGGIDPETAGSLSIDTPPLWSMLIGLNVSF